jgi:hypothetical protein
MTEIPVSSGSLPVLYVVNVEGDTGDADYTGVTKRITARGAEYRIVGALAEALKRSEDGLTAAFNNQYTDCLAIRSEVPGYFLIDASDGSDIETYEAVRGMAVEIQRLRALLVKITTSEEYKAAWDNGYQAGLEQAEFVQPDLAK